jgi:hypothetical protein
MLQIIVSILWMQNVEGEMHNGVESSVGSLKSLNLHLFQQIQLVYQSGH